ncbi:ciliogenesis and planar polarity effector 1-like isoform X2 [Mya arenaria]|uniref:ciliogenesis and planar polarity effector 1-like isoform X2 n=1 Tax=Mya arenaria TaxID=6604 RepID=UPI0022E8A79A|nr:ciliogenesis and planar polarity effector 1-like isoform X2 [Mya arenaria]
MRLDLEVLASTAIKRKKPWPRTIWIGEEQESLLLLDAPGKRVSVLYVPSGKTKRRLPKVSPLAEQAICFASTRNGRYLVGLLSNGELFIWHKDKDVVKFIPGLEKMDNNLATEKCHIDASDDCSHVLVAVGHQSFYIWAMERGETIHREQVPALKGSWHRVTVPAGMELPTDQNRECSMASVFYESLSLGYCCQCSLVFNEEAMLCVATLVLKFPDHTLSFSHSLPIFSAEWSLLEYPFPQMHPDFEPVPTPGAYVSTYSGSGQVLAVAANQRSPAKTTMLFVSPLTDTVLVGGMKNCGVSDLSKTGRQYWVCDLAWTSDNLFLACMLRNGSVCLIPRLGDPIAIETRGCSVDMGPALFLPLHPAIMVSGNAQSLEPSAAEQDPLQQTFSVATHPSLPIVLFSDGFLVTVAQLPVEVTAVTMMRGLVLESAKHLKKLSQQEDLDMTVADAYRLSKGQRGSKQNLAQGNSRGKRRNQYEFEMAEISLNATHDSDVSILDTTNKMGFDQFGAIGNMESGKIVFGEPEMIAIDPNATFTGLEASESLLKYLEESMSALTQVWKLGASYSDIWSAEVDNIVKQAVHNFYKIFSVVLDCPAVDAIMPILTPRQSSAIQNPRVYNIIVAYRNILQLLRFDTFNQHLIPAALRLIHKTIQLMLTSKELENTDPRLKTLFGCFSLLKHAETSLNRIYVWVPSDSQNGTPVSGSPRRFEPAVMMKGNQQSPGSSTDVHGGRLQNKGQFPGKRLAATWKLLYKHVMEHQAHISRAGDCSGDLVHVDKLLASIQHVLHDGEGEVTPRSAATKLSAVWLRHAFPFELLSNSDSFMYSDSDLDTSHDPKTSSPSPNFTSDKETTSSLLKSGSADSSGGFSSLVKRRASPDNAGSVKQENKTHYRSLGRSYSNTEIHGTSEFSGFDIKSSTLKIGQSPVSILKNGKEMSVAVHSASTSSQEVNDGQNKGDYSPSSVDQNSTLKITGLSSFLRSDSTSSNQSSSRSPKSGVGSKFKLFNKIKSAVSKQQTDSSLENGSKSSFMLQVGSYSSSPKGSNSSNSFMNAIKSQLKIRSYSSSPKESSSNSSTPVIMVDITQNETMQSIDIRESEGSDQHPQFDEHDKSKESFDPRSEGFEVHGSVEWDKTQSESSKSPSKRKCKAKVKECEKLSVDGEHDLALEAWKEQLKMYGGKKDNPKTARMLHSVLYTFLLRDELAQAVDFIDGMILQASVDMAMSSRELPTYEDGSRPPLMTLVTHRSQDSEEEELVPCIKNKSIRQTVQTMARFMAAYFSNQTMYIYPPHSAQPLSSVHLSSVPTKSRIIPKYHEEITQVITRENLSSLWTTERTVEYLLLSGLICETAWFAHKMGDWKTGYLLSVSHTSHREIAPQLYRKPKKPLKLSDNLWPHSILQEKLEILIKSNRADSAPTAFGKHHSRYFIPINQETNIPQLTRTLGDILTAGIVSDVELAPWLLTSLLEKLKSVVSNLSPLVPEGFYLPAPPLFCPQPGEVEMTGEQPDVQYEHEIRMEMSSIIQLILVALNSANLALPTGRWYIQDLFKMQEKAAQFKATTEGPCLELPEILQQYKIFRSELVDLRDLPSVHFVMCAFRDFCTLLWLLHVRDELSVHLRKRGSHLNDEKQGGEDTPISTLGHEYIQECFKILKWAVHLLSFSHYIADDGCIRKVILSLILELPATEDTADILAEHFYAPETFDPEVQEKLERLVSTWQSVEIVPEDDGKSARLDENVELRQSVDSDDVDDDGSVRKSVTFFQASPRAKTLSVYFHKQCDVVRKVMKKKRKIYGQYDEFVFDNELENDNTENGGARLKDDICIGSRSFETKQSYLEFLDRFYAICFTKVVENESESGRTKIHPILMPFAKVIREYEFETFLTKNEESYQKKPSSVVMASPRAKFFRSQSESQVSDTKDSPATPQRKSLFRSNSSSTVDSPKAGMSRFVSEGSLFGRNRPQVSPSRVKPNMTGMASRFFQSEDVLYRDAADREDIHWIMDVNFGQRYLALQHLLDYLHHWAGKQHLLGLHGKSDKEIGLKPTMRIEVPTQLVVLGLWLLENKYSPGKGKKDEEKEEQIYAEIEDQVDKTPRTPRDNTKQKPLTTVEELTEHDSFTQVSNIPRSRSHSPGDQRLRAHSPRAERSQRSMSAGFDVSKDRGAHDRTLDYVRSITSTQEETEQMKTAYKKVLDDGDDSSSLEVSSLEEEGYGQNLKQSNSPSRRSRAGTKSLGGSRGVESSPESKNNSAFNNTLQFEGSPDRASGKPPQTSTPLTGNSPSRRQGRKQDGLQSADVSHISLPPTGFTAQPRPEHYRSGLLGGDLAQTAPPITGVQHGADNPVNMAGMDLAQQLQAIVRGELRRMMEVQHQSMMAMMGALDGDQPPAAMQPAVLTNQRAARSLSPQRGDNQENEIERRATKGNRSMRGVLGELHNLQQTEEKQQKKKRPKSPHGKENVDSPLRVSELRSGENVEVYRVTQNEQGPNFYPNFLRIPAERDKESVRFPQIPRQAWTSQNIFPPPSQGPVEMPLLQVDRTVPAHKFPVSQRSQSLPRYLPDAGFFQAPPSQGPVGSLQGQAPYRPPQRPADSPDSGIGIPLLKLQNQEERKGRAPRFGELLPPDQVIESMEEAEQKERLRERYLREFHQLQSEKATDDYKRLFGEKLLHLDLERAQKEDRVSSPRKAQTPRATPRKSPRKTPRSMSEHVSSKSSKKSKKKLDREDEEKDEDTDQQISDQLSDKQPISERLSSRHSARHPIGEEESGEGEESLDEDATEAESVTEEEGPLHDGYAMKKGEFEAYLALENALMKTKDTSARIQLKTAIRLQRQRMMENWKRPKVDFSTNTAEQLDMGTDAEDIAPEPGYFRYSEKATSITKDTGVDPIHEAVIEYNQSRQPNVLPPDIYMGLRFNEHGQQPGSDITGQQQDSRGRNYLNVVDLDASAILHDLRERPEPGEPQLDVSMSPQQMRLRNRMADESVTRVSFEPPAVERPTRADELTVRMFDTSVQGEDRVTLAVMPRDSMPDSKYAIMQRLRDMNSQLAAIDQMSNNIEREFKSTRLAIHTLEEVTHAMEAAPKHASVDFEDQFPERLVESRAESRSDTGTLTPQRSAKSPTPSVRVTARSTARSRKSTKEDRKELSTELAKLSGLSGISDIIGDMVAQGEINLDDVGLSRREADRLVQRGIIRQEQAEDARMSLDSIKKMADTAGREGSRNKEELRQWTAQKRHKLTEEYRRHVEELREREIRPFRPAHDTTFDQSMTLNDHKAREDSRKVSRQANMSRRMDEAQHLLGDILTEKPNLPPDIPTREVSPKRRPNKDRSPISVRDRTPVRKPASVKRDVTPTRAKKGILKTRDVSPPFMPDFSQAMEGYDSYELDLEYDQQVPDQAPWQPEPREIIAPPPRAEERPIKGQGKVPSVMKVPGVVPKLKLGLEDVDEEEPLRLQQTGDTSGDLTEYCRAMQDMDVSISQDASREAPKHAPTRIEQPPSPTPSPQKTYKVKPFTEIVRLQRPERTRKQPDKLAMEYVARQRTASRMDSSRSSVRTELTQRDREMIHGSKRLPQKKPTETGPRRVKTYAERLQEMKSGEKYSTPVAPKSQYGSSIASTSARPTSRPVRPKHKPMTYVEQLQKLNEGHHKPRVGMETTVIRKPMIRSHKPPHKAKTYAQQLQELQPTKTFTGPPSKRMHKQTGARQRPYKDPYTPVGPEDFDQLEAASVVSGWSMSDDVRHILYNDVDSSIAVGQSASYAPSEQISDYYDVVMDNDRMEDDYTASVDIDDLVQIADQGSVSSGSMMSFIDWDQVDDLINDVR